MAHEAHIWALHGLVLVQGVGKEHAKWSPSCGTTYAFEADIRINSDAMDLLDERQKQEW